MGLSIRNTEVADLARQVAAQNRVTITEAIRMALANEVKRGMEKREADVAAKREAILAIIQRTAKLPRLTDMSDDEILGYDENGLPN